MLRVQGVAIELAGQVMAVLDRIQKFDPDLARQGRRAIASVPLNIAEGSDQTGMRRIQHYRYAMGSARETWAALLVAHAAKYIEKPSGELENKFNHVIGALHIIVNKPVQQPE